MKCTDTFFVSSLEGPWRLRTLTVMAAVSTCGLTLTSAQSTSLEGCALEVFRSPNKLGVGFGESVDRDGLRLVVSDPSTPYDPLGLNHQTGAVWTMEKQGDAWVPSSSQPLVGTHFGARFGESVCLDAQRLAVGSSYQSVGGVYMGAAFIYSWTPGGWALESMVSPPDGRKHDLFGYSVALEDDVLVVGAPGHDEGIPSSEIGACYVYRRIGPTWQFEEKLGYPPGAFRGATGAAVAIENKRIVVGCPDGRGVAFTYAYNGSSWTVTGTLAPPPGYLNFGYDVEIDGDTIAVAMPQFLTQFNEGEVHIFRNFGSWQLTDVLSRGKQKVDHFGTSIDLDGSRLAISTSFDGFKWPSGPLARSFEFHVFERSVGGVWSRVSIVEPVQSKQFDHVLTPESLNLEGDELIVGNYYDLSHQWVQGGSWGTSNIGSVTSFRLVEPPTPYCTAKTSSRGCVPSIAATGKASVSGENGFEIRCDQANNRTPGLLFYAATGPAALPFQGGTLCVQTPFGRTPVAFSGGSPAPTLDCSGVFRLDFNAFVSGALGGKPSPAVLVPGTRVYCQWWGRDQGFSPPFNSLLSNALDFSIAL